MLMKQQNRLGFSLVELLVVIAIIGTLSALLMANFMGARERARDAQKISDLYTLKNALRMYYNDKQSYPPSGGANMECYSGGAGCLGTVLAPYVPGIVSSIGYTYAQTDAAADGFYLKVGLEAGAGDEDINSALKCGLAAVDKVFVVCGK